MVDKDFKTVKAFLGSIRRKQGSNVSVSLERLLFRLRQAEADVEQLGGVIMNERANRKEVGMYCMRKTKDKIIITRRKR